jgi:hypothetical protein
MRIHPAVVVGTVSTFVACVMSAYLGLLPASNQKPDPVSREVCGTRTSYVTKGLTLDEMMLRTGARAIGLTPGELYEDIKEINSKHGALPPALRSPVTPFMYDAHKSQKWHAFIEPRYGPHCP